ncbi:MAG TPA: sensor histidine kinase [Candidatus Omnitrophica bacterium]|nr:sensor histidine kinase [Candidatus Omnitrophota bacterium]
MEADLTFSLVGIGAFIAAFSLGIVLMFKMEEIRKLRITLDKLKRSFDELDEQAKLIVKTDLELNKTQEELDKKVSGLYTLQRLSRAISTTLDENQIFSRIEESLVIELGFERAIAFSFDSIPASLTDNTKNNSMSLRLKMQAGYNAEEIKKIKTHLEKQQILAVIMKNNTIFSSLTMTGGPLEEAIKIIKNICGLNSFVASVISTKDGHYGLIIMGNESSFAVLTEGDEEIVAILSTQLGQAIENAKLFEETFRSQQQLERRVKDRTRELSVALEEIKQVSKRKSEFVSAVSHELRTPLTSIKGYASILAAGKLGDIPEQVKARIEKINKHSNELTELINNLLDISRIESGRVELKIVPQNISQMIENISDMLMPPIKEKGMEFSLDLPKELPLVLADNIQIKRVFINLIGNAIKYSPAKGKINLSINRTKDDYLTINISDTGYGIPQEDLKKIFEEFYRVDTARTQGIKGTGLGLSLVKYIVEAHRGQIWATSKVGQGSTFSFTLPISK